MSWACKPRAVDGNGELSCPQAWPSASWTELPGKGVLTHNLFLPHWTDVLNLCFVSTCKFCVSVPICHQFWCPTCQVLSQSPRGAHRLFLDFTQCHASEDLSHWAASSLQQFWSITAGKYNVHSRACGCLSFGGSRCELGCFPIRYFREKVVFGFHSFPCPLLAVWVSADW